MRKNVVKRLTPLQSVDYVLTAQFSVADSEIVTKYSLY